MKHLVLWLALAAAAGCHASCGEETSTTTTVTEDAAVVAPQSGARIEHRRGVMMRPMVRPTASTAEPAASP